MPYRGRFAVYDHQGKARAYIDALERRGWRSTHAFERALFCLSDLDMLGRAQVLRDVMARGGRVFLYPHAARPAVQWDGMYPVLPGVSANFVIGEGGAEVMRRYGYPVPVHVVGWPYGELRQFRASSYPTTILFGPIHANGNGWLSELDKKINQAVFSRLLALVEKGCIHLKVRYLRGLQLCGLQPDTRVEYIRGRADQSYKDIDQADVVVAHQTLAYIAVARGAPTVMMAEDEPPRSGNSESNFVRVASWQKYRELMMFPLDILASDDPMALLQRAARSDVDVAEWRRLFIGEPFNQARFVSTLEGYLS